MYNTEGTIAKETEREREKERESTRGKDNAINDNTSQ